MWLNAIWRGVLVSAVLPLQAMAQTDFDFSDTVNYIRDLTTTDRGIAADELGVVTESVFTAAEFEDGCLFAMRIDFESETGRSGFVVEVNGSSIDLSTIRTGNSFEGLDASAEINASVVAGQEPVMLRVWAEPDTALYEDVIRGEEAQCDAEKCEISGPERNFKIPLFGSRADENAVRVERAFRHLAELCGAVADPFAN